jgi:hypothetical protein
MKRPWTADDLLPPGAALTLSRAMTTEKGLVIEAAGPASARCPCCHQPSHTRHSRYWRTLRDVAAHGEVVTLRFVTEDASEPGNRGQADEWRVTRL